jgi:hypothetical protein
LVVSDSFLSHSKLIWDNQCICCSYSKLLSVMDYNFIVVVLQKSRSPSVQFLMLSCYFVIYCTWFSYFRLIGVINVMQHHT